MKLGRPRMGTLMLATLGLLLMLQVQVTHAQPPGWKQRLLRFLSDEPPKETKSESETKIVEESTESLSDDTSKSTLLIPTVDQLDPTDDTGEDEEEEDSEDFEEDESETNIVEEGTPLHILTVDHYLDPTDDTGEEEEDEEDEEDDEDSEDFEEEEEEDKEKMLLDDVIDNDKMTTEKKEKAHIPILSTIDAMLKVGGYVPSSKRNLAKKKAAHRMVTTRMARTHSTNSKKGKARVFMRLFQQRSRRNSKTASSGSGGSGRGKTTTNVNPDLVKLFENLNSSRETDEDDTEHDTKTRESNKIVSVLSDVDMSIFKPKPSAAQTPKNTGVGGGFYRCQLPQEDLNCLTTTITIIGNPPSGPGSVPGTNNGFVSADGVIVLPFNHDWCIDTFASAARLEGGESKISETRKTRQGTRLS
eukprot:scaffold39012_cov59-Attheya_sp.AAC.2